MFNILLKVRLYFFERCGIQAKIIDFVEYVSTADPISLISCRKIHLIFERGSECQIF